MKSVRSAGGTRLYDAILQSCEAASRTFQSPGHRRALILISDGGDNQSDHTAAEAVDMALRSKLPIYAIGLSSSGIVTKGGAILEQMSEHSGGRFFGLDRPTDVMPRLLDALAHEYLVTAVPSQLKPDAWHKVEFKPLTKDVRVSAPSAYFVSQ